MLKLKIIVYSAIFFVTIALIFLSNLSSLIFQDKIYGIIIILLGLIPVIINNFNKHEKEIIPLMPLTGFFYIVAYGIPMFFLNNSDYIISHSEYEFFYKNYLSDAFKLTILGIVFLFIGYYGSSLLVNEKLKPIKFKYVSLDKQILCGWILYSLFLLFQIIPTLKSTPSINQIELPICYTSLGILLKIILNNKLNLIHKIAIYSALIFTFIKFLLLGSLAPPIFLLIFLGIIYWTTKKALPWKLIFFIISITFILNPIKNEYRTYVWWNSSISLSSYEKVILFKNLTFDHYTNSSIDVNKFPNDSEVIGYSVIKRIASINLFSLVVALTPDYIPYWQGHTYHTLFTSFVPRAIWRDKPESTIGQDFGHRYGILSTEDTGTSINLPWLVEFYVNFGYFGVIIGMFLVGVFFRLLLEMFNIPNHNVIYHSMAVAIIFGLFFAESNLALMIGAIIPAFISLILIIYVSINLDLVKSFKSINKIFKKFIFKQ
jgi:hypothetical protein